MILSNPDPNRGAVSWQLTELLAANKRAKSFSSATLADLSEIDGGFEKIAWQQFADLDSIAPLAPPAATIDNISLELGLASDDEIVPTVPSGVEQNKSSKVLEFESEGDAEVFADSEVDEGQEFEDEKQLSADSDLESESFLAGLAEGRRLEAEERSLQAESLHRCESVLEDIRAKLEDMPPLWSQLGELTSIVAETLVREKLSIDDSLLSRFYKSVIEEACIKEQVPVVVELNSQIEDWFAQSGLTLGFSDRVTIKADPSLSIGDIRISFDEVVVEKMLTSDAELLSQRISEIVAYGH
jgi:flagellar biosynthesis/type III secretory pathway protein FliH